MTVFVDLNGPAGDLFETAGLFRKGAIVTARQVMTPENLITQLENGFHETERLVPAGHWIVTNPGGEEYAIPAEKFHTRYDWIEGDDYRAKGIIRAFPNHTGEDVEIVAPWGEEQYGDVNCWFATALDSELNTTTDRYIIGGDEFTATYERYTPSS